jgi:hypothetical protein
MGFIRASLRGGCLQVFYQVKTDGQFQKKIRTASVQWAEEFYCHNINKHKWNDDEWLSRRTNEPSFKNKPINIYELHLGSWKRDYHNPDFCNEWGYLSYRQLAYEIVEYVKKMGYTHVELMPVMEHPLDISWGYQVTCYYAPTSRFGGPEDFMFFIDHCHQNNIGVIIDWVPAHFPSDEHALAYYDGKQIYAYESWKKGFHKDWNTYIFDYGRHECRISDQRAGFGEKYHADIVGRCRCLHDLSDCPQAMRMGTEIHGGRRIETPASFAPERFMIIRTLILRKNLLHGWVYHILYLKEGWGLT